MDPKMDTGFLAEGETMEDSYDIWRELLPEECLGIIDQLLCLEVCVLFLLMEVATKNQTDGMAYGSSIVTDAIHQSLH